MMKEPMEYEKRNCTDVCCLVIGLLFSASLIALACFTFNYDTYVKSSIPSDSSGKVCGVDYPGYNTIYFINPTDFSQRLCVETCPKPGDDELTCMSSGNFGCAFNSLPGYSVQYYDTEMVHNSNGFFCMPKDASLAAKMATASGLDNRNKFYNSWTVFVTSLIICLGTSLLYTLLMQCIPRSMVNMVIFGGLVVCAVLAFLVYFYPSTQINYKIIIGVILSFVTLLILMTICGNRQSIRMCGIFHLEATKFTSANCGIFGFILLFDLITAAFMYIVIMEYRSFWTTGTTSFNAQSTVYYEINNTWYTTALTSLLIIQIIWGLSFIKESFNFCVAGKAVYWYLSKDIGYCAILKLLFMKHLGSVIAASFMSGFFTIPDLVVDLFKDSNSLKDDPNYSYTSNSYCCSNVLDLVRSDAIAYIVMTGNPFCNSAKYCEYLCHESFALENSQSVNRTYRICGHVLIAGLMCIVALYLNGTNIEMYTIGVLLIVCIFICTLFIAIHSDAAEAIQIMFLMEDEFRKRYDGDKKQFDLQENDDLGRMNFLDKDAAKKYHPSHQELACLIIDIKK